MNCELATPTFEVGEKAQLEPSCPYRIIGKMESETFSISSMTGLRMTMTCMIDSGVGESENALGTHRHSQAPSFVATHPICK